MIDLGIKLYGRANIECKTYHDKDVVIYEDHRYILNILFTAFKLKTIDKPATLIFFDYHQDGCPPTQECLEKIKNIDLETISERDFRNFIEFDLAPNDDDWLLAGMELGLIGNTICIGSETGDFKFQDKYTDHKSTVHKIFIIDHLWHALDSRGSLGDIVKKETFSDLWEIIGRKWNGELAMFQFTEDGAENLVLDFDLDCFTYDCVGQRRSWPKDRFMNLFNEYINRYMSAKYFVQQLIQRTKFITIAKESGCCGGYRESQHILNMLDELFFEGELNS